MPSTRSKTRRLSAEELLSEIKEPTTKKEKTTKASATKTDPKSVKGTSASTADPAAAPRNYGPVPAALSRPIYNRHIPVEELNEVSRTSTSAAMHTAKHLTFSDLPFEIRRSIILLSLQTETAVRASELLPMQTAIIDWLAREARAVSTEDMPAGDQPSVEHTEFAVTVRALVEIDDQTSSDLMDVLDKIYQQKNKELANHWLHMKCRKDNPLRRDVDCFCKDVLGVDGSCTDDEGLCKATQSAALHDLRAILGTRLWALCKHRRGCAWTIEGDATRRMEIDKIMKYIERNGRMWVET